MININRNEMQSFEVRVGHNQVTVQGFTRDDAIRNARAKLSVEMPRLWDVIQTMDHDRFEVQRLK